MKFTIDRTKLAGVIPPLKNCCLSANRTRLPVRLSASGKLLYVSYYDEASRSVCHSVPASVVEEGAAAFDPTVLDKLAKWLGKTGRGCGTVQIDGVAGDAFEVKAVETGAYCHLPSGAPDDLCAPVVIRHAGELAEAPVTLLRDIVSRAKAGGNSTAFYAENLCISFSRTGTKVVWTDGCLLLCGEYPEGISLESGRAVIPLSAVVSLLRQADPSEDVMVFGKSGIRCGGLSIAFAEFDEEKQKYPDFSVVIQPQGDTEISFTAEAFREALKRVSSCIKDDVIIRSKADRGINLMAVRVEKESKRLEDLPRAEVWFDGTVSAPGEQYGYASAYCVDVTYLKAVLAGRTGRVTVRSTDQDSPLYISFENSAIRAVLMPKMADFIYKSV